MYFRLILLKKCLFSSLNETFHCMLLKFKSIKYVCTTYHQFCSSNFSHFLAWGGGLSIYIRPNFEVFELYSESGIEFRKTKKSGIMRHHQGCFSENFSLIRSLLQKFHLMLEKKTENGVITNSGKLFEFPTKRLLFTNNSCYYL